MTWTDAQIEAAAREIHLAFEGDDDIAWEREDDRTRDIYLGAAKDALEAASRA